MALLVLKFGGSSISDLKSVRRVARCVAKETAAGHGVVVVVSAMAAETDRLLGLCRAIATVPDDAECDAAVSTGEQLSAALLALALRDMGIDAQSCPGWRLPIVTDGIHSRARIVSVATGTLFDRLDRGRTTVVAGFQGIGPDGRITTLGRGGSDASAVALAIALNADACAIYTDVDGVYTADPRIVTAARKLGQIAIEDMLESASLGASVLQARAVAMAMKHGTRLQVRSSFGDDPGTIICSRSDMVEQERASGVVCCCDQAKINIELDTGDLCAVAAVFGCLAAADVSVDMISHPVSPTDGTSDVAFTVARGDAARAARALHDCGFQSVGAALGVVKVSVVGVGLRSRPDAVPTLFKALSDADIAVQMLSTSETRISALIARDHARKAARVLHGAYGLDAERTGEEWPRGRVGG